MKQWSLEKNRSLPEILCTSGSLTSDQVRLLEPMVEAQLRLHEGSPSGVLSTLSSVPKLVESIRQAIADHEVQASINRFASTVPGGTLPGSAAEARTETQGNTGIRYIPKRLHAQGGLGAVYTAVDSELNREVALKEIRPEFAEHQESRARFVLEAEITGGLEHPGIVPVYGLGHYADGRPYYAMRFIRGKSLKDAIDEFHGRRTDKTKVGENQDRVGERAAKESAVGPDFSSVLFRKLLGRFVDVCQAIAYAHSRGILHRDLKPGNIMLGNYGETLVVDWGLAKVLGRVDNAPVIEEKTLQPSSGSGVTPTIAGQAMGTPAYMPPEQASGELNQLGPASDDYSLGATLYHLLTGETAFRADTVAQLLANVVSGTFPVPQSLQRGIPKPLQAICLKAMSLKPCDRYVSPQDLSDEVERWLSDDPVLAHHEAISERIVRFARRNRARAFSAVIAVTATAVVAMLAAILINLSRAAAEVALKSEKNALAAEKAARIGESNERRRAETKAYMANIRLANSSWNDNLIRTSRQALESCTSPTPGLDRRNWEWHYLENRNDHSLLDIDLGPFSGLNREQWTQFGIFGSAISPDGRLIAITKGSDVHLRDGVTGENHRILTAKASSPSTQPNFLLLQRVAFSSDGQSVFSASGHTVFCWDIETGAQTREYIGPVTRGFQDLSCSPDGQRFAVSSADGAVEQWNIVTGELLTTTETSGASAMSVSYSHDGRLLVCGYDDGSIRVWNADDGVNQHTVGERGKVIHRGRQLMVHAAVQHPSNGRVYAAMSDGAIEVWDLSSRTRVDRWQPHNDIITCLKIAADGSLLVSGSTDQSLALIETDNGQVVRRIRGHDDRVTSLSLSANERRIVSVSLDGNVRVWDMRGDQACRITDEYVNLNYRIRSSADGRYVVHASHLYTTIADAQTLGPLFYIDCPQGRISMSDDGNLALIGGAVWYLPGQSVLHRFYPVSTTYTDPTVAELSPDGTRVAIVEGGHVVVFDAITGAVSHRSPEIAFAVRDVLFDRDGEAIFCCGKEIHQWHPSTGVIKVVGGESDDAMGFALCRSKPLLAGYQPDGTIEIRNTETGILIGRCVGHRQQVTDVGFSPDGTRMLSCSMDKMIKVWDTATLEELCTLDGHKDAVFGVCFSSDGRRIFSSGWDNTVRTWFGDPDATEMNQLCNANSTARIARKLTNGKSLSAEEQAAVIENDPFLSVSEKELAFQSLGRRRMPQPGASKTAADLSVFHNPGREIQDQAVAAFIGRDVEKLAAIQKLADEHFTRDVVLLRKIRHLQTLLDPPAIGDPDAIPADVKRVRIADLKFETESVGWAGPMRNQSLMEAGFPPFIEVGGEFFESGLWAHPPSVYSIRLNRLWKTLTTGYGLRIPRQGLVDFVVKGDGNELFRSGPFVSTRADTCSVNVEGVDLLELVVEDGGNGTNRDWAVWMEPMLHR